MQYGGTAHNRTVYASGAEAPSGSVRLGRFTPTPHSTKVLQPANLTVCFLGLQNLRKQPERYAKWTLKWNKKLCKII
jgi:hypothetical protein